MREADTGWLKDLLTDHLPPCVSLYQPVHRAAPPAHEDPVRFNNLLEEVERQLKQRYPTNVVREMVDKVRSAQAEIGAHGGDRDTVAVFASKDYFQVITLQEPIRETVVVADNFHVKPLIRTLQSAGRFQLLCLSQKRAQVFEGTHYRLSPLPLHNIPEDANIVSGMTLSHEVSSQVDLAEAHTQLPNEGSAPHPPAFTERFFHAVDKAVWENYSRKSHLPLILVAVERNQSIFRQISANPLLMNEGIRLDPNSLDADRLRQEAWRIMEPHYQAELSKLADQFRFAKAHHLGSDQLFQVAESLVAGRVGTLLVETGKQIPGRLHRASGLIEPITPTNPLADDVLDDLAELTLKMDGQVLVIPPDQMPTQTGVAAIYRY